MPRRRIASLAAALAATVVIASCGGSVGFARSPARPSPATLAQIRTVITSFARAMAAGDGSSACDLLDAGAQQESAQEATAGQSDGSLTDLQLCQQAIATVGAQLTKADRAILDSIHVGAISDRQDWAAVEPSQITSPDGSTRLTQDASGGASNVELVLQNGRWLIDSLG